MIQWLTEALANPTGSSEARTAFQRQRSQTFYFHSGQSLDVGCHQGESISLEEAAPFSPRQFLEKNSITRG